MAEGFPTERMEVTHLVVVSDLGRSLPFYRDVLGAELFREYGGTSAVLRLLGNWLLVLTVSGSGGGANVTVGSPARPRHGEHRDDLPGPGLPVRLRAAPLARRRLPDASRRPRRGGPGLLPRPRRPPLRDQRGDRLRPGAGSGG